MATSTVVPNLVRGFKIGNYTTKLTAREISLYALGVGANVDPLNSDDLKFTYEKHPLYSIIPSITSAYSLYGFEQISQCPGMPQYDPMALLHGEQIIKVKKSLKEGMKLITQNKIIDVADKKSGALVTIESISRDGDEIIAVNHAKLFVRGIGGFGDVGVLPAVSFPKPEKEKARSVQYKTAQNQALIYRLAGLDLNPLHIDPQLAKENGGFDRPILHGLCTLGFSVRGFCSLYNTTDVKEIGVRFTAPVLPG